MRTRTCKKRITGKQPLDCSSLCHQELSSNSLNMSWRTSSDFQTSKGVENTSRSRAFFNEL